MPFNWCLSSARCPSSYEWNEIVKFRPIISYEDLSSKFSSWTDISNLKVIAMGWQKGPNAITGQMGEITALVAAFLIIQLLDGLNASQYTYHSLHTSTPSAKQSIHSSIHLWHSSFVIQTEQPAEKAEFE